MGTGMARKEVERCVKLVIVTEKKPSYNSVVKRHHLFLS